MQPFDAARVVCAEPTLFDHCFTHVFVRKTAGGGGGGEELVGYKVDFATTTVGDIKARIAVDFRVRVAAQARPLPYCTRRCVLPATESNEVL